MTVTYLTSSGTINSQRDRPWTPVRNVIAFLPLTVVYLSSSWAPSAGHITVNHLSGHCRELQTPPVHSLRQRHSTGRQIAMATSPDCWSPRCEVSVSMAMEQMNGNPSLFLRRGNRTCGWRQRRRKGGGGGGGGVVSMLACVWYHSLTKAAPSPPSPKSSPSSPFLTPPPPFSLNSKFAIMHGRSSRSGRLKRADDLEQRNEVRASELRFTAAGSWADRTRREGRRRTDTLTQPQVSALHETVRAFIWSLYAFILEFMREQYTLIHFKVHAVRFKSVLQIKDGYKKMRLQFPTAATRG